METQQTEQTVSILASARLTEVQVQSALAEFLLKNQELKDALADKTVEIRTQWQTSKWSNPDALVHVFFTENPAADSGEENPTNISSSDISTPTGSPFFQESESK